MRAFRLGVTGGLASGKSTVAGWLRDAGFRILDADQVVAELYQPGEPGARRVEELFGSSFLDPRGAVDRERLAARVFADPAARRRLEGAIHPLVRQRAEERWAAAEGVVGLEATLLVEAGLAAEFDLVVSVEADPDRRLRWAVSRGLGEAEARARMAAQGDGAARRAAAHRLLRNDGSLEDLRRRVDELVVEVRRLAAARSARGPGEGPDRKP